jgi:hypothetical protein
VAQANPEIRGRTALGQQDRRMARRALNQADGLLGDLEDLQLRGEIEVPAWFGNRVAALRRVSMQAGIRNQRLDCESGAIKLTDDVYKLEERLMGRLRWRTGQRLPALVSA